MNGQCGQPFKIYFHKHNSTPTPKLKSKHLKFKADRGHYTTFHGIILPSKMVDHKMNREP